MKRAPKQPLQLSIYNGEKRKESNEKMKEYKKHADKMHIGEKVFIASDEIREDEKALRKWNELVRLYKDFVFVTEVDQGTIEKYCLLHSEWFKLLKDKKELQQENISMLEYYNKLDTLKIDSQLNKKLDLLIKMEDRLYLNPLSRLKSVPKKQEEKPVSQLEKLGFGNV